MLHEQQYFPSEFVGFKALQKEGKTIFMIMQSSDLGNLSSVLGLFYIYKLLRFTLPMCNKLGICKFQYVSALLAPLQPWIFFAFVKQ